MKKAVLLFLTMILMQSCQSQQKKEIETKMDTTKLEKATFAGGCFWCTEALFLEVKGVQKIIPGYIGGTVENPTYKQVCTGNTGHAEAIEIEFDPNQVSFGTLLELFFATHDPTTLNRQGADIGTQYRSEVFYHNSTQEQLTKDYIDLLNKENTFGAKVVTQLSAATVFYAAEKYHQNYYNQNKNENYCHFVITPKIEKLKHKFADKLK